MVKVRSHDDAVGTNLTPEDLEGWYRVETRVTDPDGNQTITTHYYSDEPLLIAVEISVPVRMFRTQLVAQYQHWVDKLGGEWNLIGSSFFHDDYEEENS